MPVDPCRRRAAINQWLDQPVGSRQKRCAGLPATVALDKSVEIVPLETAWRLRMLRMSQTYIWGNAMRKTVLAAAVCAVASLQAASAAERSCYSPTDLEAEQAIVFQTNLMVVSSACRDEVYGLFRARNKDAIIRYQRIMINHFRREGFRDAQSRFDSWNTSLANEIALKQGASSDLGRVPAGNEHAQNGRRARLERAARLRRGAGREPGRNPSALRPVSRFAATRRRPRARHDSGGIASAESQTVSPWTSQLATPRRPIAPPSLAHEVVTKLQIRHSGARARPASPEPMNPAANILANRCGHGFRACPFGHPGTTNFLWSSFPLSFANPDPHRKTSARQQARPHQEFVDGAGALPALADRPHDQRLAAPHVAGGKQFRR